MNNKIVTTRMFSSTWYGTCNKIIEYAAVKLSFRIDIIISVVPGRPGIRVYLPLVLLFDEDRDLKSRANMQCLSELENNPLNFSFWIWSLITFMIYDKPSRLPGVL